MIQQELINEGINISLLDVFSRWAYAKAYEKANTQTALNFVKKAEQIASFPFRVIQSDHGSEILQ